MEDILHQLIGSLPIIYKVLYIPGGKPRRISEPSTVLTGQVFPTSYIKAIQMTNLHTGPQLKQPNSTNLNTLINPMPVHVHAHLSHLVELIFSLDAVKAKWTTKKPWLCSYCPLNPGWFIGFFNDDLF